MGKVYGEAEAADFLGYSPRTMQGLRYHGRGPKYCKVGSGRGGKVVYREEDLLDFLESRLRTSTSDPGPVEE